MSRIDAVRALVRPLITLLLVAAQIALALLWTFGIKSVLAASGGGLDSSAALIENQQAMVEVVLASAAFAGLSPFTMMAMTYYFRMRDDRPAAPPEA